MEIKMMKKSPDSKCLDWRLKREPQMLIDSNGKFSWRTNIAHVSVLIEIQLKFLLVRQIFLWEIC